MLKSSFQKTLALLVQEILKVTLSSDCTPEFQNSHPDSDNRIEKRRESIKKYDGIHIDCTTKTPPDNYGYNIQNIVSNNSIALPFSPKGDVLDIARYGIYMGDGDAWRFVKDNFIVSARMMQTIKIESPTDTTCGTIGGGD